MSEKPKKKRPTSAPAIPSSEKAKRAWLRLIRTPNIGGVTFWELLAHFGSAESALEALPEFARNGGGVWTRDIPKDEALDAELEKAGRAGMRLVAKGEAGYPPLLAQVEIPPPLLYVKGDGAVWRRPPLAIVGARQASAAGLKFAAGLGAELGRRGFVIVSGLARGIDAAAHRAALPFATCAVLPGGLDTVYPPEHASLAAGIAEKGLLVSECPPGFVARAVDFPRRNRIVSGASLGVVVVEAAERSGSLITARLAGEQNREVFAVPGHPLEGRAAGTNKLLKEGAVLATSADDIVDALAQQLGAFNSFALAGNPHMGGRHEPRENVSTIQPAGNTASGPEFAGEASGEILRFLSLTPIDVDELCRISGLEARIVNAALLSLDLSGLIERRGLRQVALRP